MGYVLFGGVALVVGAAIGYKIAYEMTKRRASEWYVRPHTARSLGKIPVEGKSEATVVDAAFVRTNLPNSTSKMER